MAELNGELRVQVAPELSEFVETALVRFGYLYPDIEAGHKDGEISLGGANQSELAKAARQLRYTLYREAILYRYEAARLAMYRGLFT